MAPPARIIATTSAAALAISCALAGALPAAAGAAPGEDTIQQALPAAVALCARIASGEVGKRMKAAAAQTSAACTTLEAEFASAQTAVLSARQTLSAEIASARGESAGACSEPEAVEACLLARRQSRAALAPLQAQLHAAQRAYFASVIHARDAFWTAIEAVRSERQPPKAGAAPSGG